MTEMYAFSMAMTCKSIKDTYDCYYASDLNNFIINFS